MEETRTIDRLYECMVEMKMKPVDVYKKLGIGRQRFFGWKDRGSVPKDFEIPLSEMFNVRLEWFKLGEEPKRILSDVVERIAQAMQTLSMQPFDLADATGGLIAPDTVEMWLDGRAEPRDAELDVIAEPLGRTAAWLKTGVSEIKEDRGLRVVYDARGEPMPDDLSQDEVDVVRCMRNMGAERRERLLAMAHDSAHAARYEHDTTAKKTSS